MFGLTQRLVLWLITWRVISDCPADTEGGHVVVQVEEGDLVGLAPHHVDNLQQYLGLDNSVCIALITKNTFLN